MKERPILFSGPMVKAILDGRKTQTRRFVKPQPMPEVPFVGVVGGFAVWEKWYAPQVSMRCEAKCSYGQPGNRLWVRETLDAEMYASMTWNGLTYKADGGEVIADHPPGWTPPLKTIKTHRESGDNIPGGGFDWYTGTVPSIFMPRWASRITLEITGIRVERLQEIGRDDAFAEGVATVNPYQLTPGLPPGMPACFKNYLKDDGWFAADPIASYRSLWESINGPGSWDANPWVWVVEFRRLV